MDVDRRTVIYYEDEHNDEFSVAKITPKKIDGSYRYDRNSFFKKLTRFFWYRVVFTPIAWCYAKLVFHHKTVGKECLKPYKKQGYFLYGNHTQDIGDAFLPNAMDVGKTHDFIVHPNNVSMPFLGRLTPALGALPLPDDLQAYRHFSCEIETRIQKGHAVVIYPEAHIWPFYTKIRPFPDTSFQYPIKLGTPAFCFTNTYQKRKHSKKPRIVTYVDGPFFPDPALSLRQQRADLRNRIHTQMCRRAEASDVFWITYLKKETAPKEAMTDHG